MILENIGGQTLTIARRLTLGDSAVRTLAIFVRVRNRLILHSGAVGNPDFIGSIRPFRPGEQIEQSVSKASLMGLCDEVGVADDCIVQAMYEAGTLPPDLDVVPWQHPVWSQPVQVNE